MCWKAAIEKADGLGTIVNDDGLPRISISDAGATEGPGATARFNVSLSGDNATQVTVNYVTANGTATSPADYTGVSTAQTVTFPAHATGPQTISIPVAADALSEGSETFFVRLSSASGATIADNEGLGTIFDDNGTNVAIVRNFPDPEINTLQTYLTEMGLSSQVFDQAEITAGALASYDVVIWDDLGFQANGITDANVDTFQSLFNAGIPLYFIGDDLAFSNINLSTARSAQWVALTHLLASNNFGGNGSVTIGTLAHPVTGGPFGLVPDFNYTGDPDSSAHTNTGEIVLANSRHDVLLSFENASVRTLTQNFLAVNASDAAGVAAKKILFKNAIAWLLKRSAVVTNTNSGGAGSLRAAINAANAQPYTEIRFNIPNTDPGFNGSAFVIRPTAALPNVTGLGTTINGKTQRDFTGNTNSGGPVVVLSGSSLTVPANGLQLNANQCIVRELIINGFNGAGVRIDSNNNRITNCFFGTNAAGTAAVPNANGININGGDNNAIGSITTDTGNLISGNTGAGVTFNSNSIGNTIQNNRIGLNRAGTGALGNGGAGVRLGSGSSNTIQDNLISANEIASNAGDGVAAPQGNGGINANRGNRIRRNVMYQNGGLGINLVPTGEAASLPTPNDAGDGDSGPNRLQNAPVVNSVTFGGGVTTIAVRLNSTPNEAFSIDIFRSPASDGPAASVEGRIFLGTRQVTTDAGGNATFSMTPTGDFSSEWFSTTATRTITGDTSEFSAAKNAASGSLTVTNTNDSGAGSLRAALTFAESDPDASTITFAAGLSGIIQLQSPLDDVTTNVTIQGPGANVLTVRRNAGGNYGLLNIGATATISGLALANGNLPSGAGGAISHDTGTLTLRNCHFIGNNAASGGAIYTASDGVLIVENCTLSGNSAASGGGIFSQLDLSGHSVTIRNSTISGNTASVKGGGLFNRSGLMTLNSCTIAGNSAPAGKGSGVADEGEENSQGQNISRTEIRNSILAGNTNSDVDFINVNDVFVSNGYNLVGNGNATNDFQSTGDRISVTPTQLNLGPLQVTAPGTTPTRALLVGSIAFNAGNTGLTTDQRGLARPQNGADDIGAFELRLSESLVVTTLADENDGTSDPAYGAGTSLREAIIFANSNPDVSDISFASGVTGDLNLSSRLPNLASNLSIVGAGRNALRVRRTTTATFRIFKVASGVTVSLSGMTISGGNATVQGESTGAGILNNGTLNLRNCNVEVNDAQAGGGLYNAGDATVTDCTFRNNNVTIGLGGAIYSSGDLTVSGSTLSSNEAGEGGGIFTAFNSDFTRIRNCTLYGNAATSSGGALMLFGRNTSLDSCTITANNAPVGGGSGIASHDNGDMTVELGNCIVTLNRNTDIDAINETDNPFVSRIANLVGSGNATSIFTALADHTGVTAAQIKLDDLRLNAPGKTETCALLAGSIAIDHGSSTQLYDQRGVLREPNFNDVGAYEVVASAKPPSKPHGRSGASG